MNLLLSLLLQSAVFVGWLGLVERFLLRRSWLPGERSPLLGVSASFVTVGILSFGLFWIYVWQWQVGFALSVLAIGAGFWGFVGSVRNWRRSLPRVPLVFWALLGVTLFYLGFYRWQIGTSRFSAPPADVVLSRNFAENLRSGRDFTWAGADWRSSDRPPLQTALYLLVSCFAQIDFYYSFCTLLQAFWVLAFFQLAEMFSLSGRQIQFVFSALLCSGFVLLSTVYTWPKMVGAAYFVSSLYLLWSVARWPQTRSLTIFAAAGLSCALLCHGGLVFSVPLLAVCFLSFFGGARKRFWRQGFLYGGVALLLYLPWIFFQKFINPPGDKLFRDHLTLFSDDHTTSLLRLVWRSHTEFGWESWWAHRKSNLAAWFPDSWLWQAKHLREQEFFRLSLVLGFLNAGWIALLRRQRRHLQTVFLVGIGLSLVMWVALLQQDSSAVVHQGSFVTPFVLLFLLAGGVFSFPERVVRTIWILHVSYFFWLWWFSPVVVTNSIPGFEKIFFALMGAGGAALLVKTFYRSNELSRDSGPTNLCAPSRERIPGVLPPQTRR
ncbi:MAG: hypothetical protein JST16_18430 [Bdellovibrionales bacterium]|nr:hypothetical protein [Bdellovibrionales bacterium]